MISKHLLSIFSFLIILLFLSCKSTDKTSELSQSFEILDEEANSLISINATVEKIDSGFTWTEGPLWLSEQKILLFSDIPPNKVMSWSESKGLSTYLSPSGYTGQIPRGGEPGANGLILNQNGQLVLCQHGDRRVAVMDSTLDNPSSDFTTIIDNYKGKKFSSPNDAVYSSSGNLYFTDPPYGLSSPELQETTFNGVYRYSKDGILTVVDSTLTRPNGIAFSSDEKYLYVANSDPKKAIYKRFEIDEKSGKVLNQEVMYDATPFTSEKGLPDGLKVNKDGYIFATGPGGVWVFNPAGKPIAKIKTGQATSNCAFGENENILFMTADDYLMKATLK